MIELLTYLILISAVIVCVLGVLEPMSLTQLGEPRDKGLGYLSAMVLTIVTITLLESFSAVLSLFNIKEDFAQEIYDKAEEKKGD